MKAYGANWTPELEATLRRMWEIDLLSTGVIAMKFGMSRSAVAGKVRRMNLTMRMEARCRKPKPKKIQRRKPQAPVELISAPLPVEDVPAKPLVTFAELEPHHCRAPYGDPKEPGFGFCGCTSVPGKSYCAAHLARFTMPVRVGKAPGPKPRVEEPTFAPPKQHEIEEVLA